MPTDDKTYFAKSTWPPGNKWRGPWTTKENAIGCARWFVDEWAKIGAEVRAAVFYRDGSMLTEIGNVKVDQG